MLGSTVESANSALKRARAKPTDVPLTAEVHRPNPAPGQRRRFSPGSWSRGSPPTSMRW